jgi:hypothetical protein
MDKFASDLVNGIVGGLIATFLTLVIHRIWLNIIRPWYEERVYHDAHFEGVWTATETFSDTTPVEADTFTMELKRQGHHVTGTLRCIDGPDKDDVYLIEGTFNNLILTLTWVPENKRALDRGTLAIKLVENGKKFVGCGAFYSNETEKVHTSVFQATPKA